MHLLSFVSSKQLPDSTSTLRRKQWEHEIICGNQAYGRGNFLHARVSYEAALVLAKTSINELIDTSTPGWLAIDADEQIGALVVTQHNLANLFLKQGQIESVINHLCIAHETVFQLAHHPRTDIQRLARRHLNVTYRELMAFTHLHGKHNRIDQSLVMTQYICDCCRKKIGLC